jgi:hypothetical protein
MTATRTEFDAARRHLDVFTERWKADHIAAMKCRDLEEFLAEAVMVFRLVDQLSRLRRDYVFRGLEETDARIDAAEKELYHTWIQKADQEAAQLEPMEKAFGSVDGADQFRECLAKARRFLADWTPAMQSLAVAHRACDLSEEDAAELDSILRDPNRGRPKWPGQRVPPGDPSRLK